LTEGRESSTVSFSRHFGLKLAWVRKHPVIFASPNFRHLFGGARNGSDVLSHEPGFAQGLSLEARAARLGDPIGGTGGFTMIRIPKWLLLLLVVAFLLGLAAPVLAEEAKGKLKTITADKNEFVLTDKDGKDWTFKMDDNAKIKLNDKDSKLNDLKEGDEVKITYEKKGDQFIATEVRCERK
jgi:hypothetical protein